MDIVIKKLILFLIMFTIVYLAYYFLVIRDFCKKSKKKKNKIEERVEIQYLVKKYKIDIKKINVNSLLWDISFTNSFIISFTVIIIGLDIIKEYIWKILFGFVILIPLILICYKILGLKYIKEMRKKNE